MAGVLAFLRKPAKKRGRRADEPRKSWNIPRPEIKDLFLFGGIGGAGYGVYQIYPPSAYVLVGGIFIALGLLLYTGGKKDGTP